MERPNSIPGCRVESTTFFANHSSAVIDLMWPCLYDTMSFFAFSRPAAETSSVLPSVSSQIDVQTPINRKTCCGFAQITNHTPWAGDGDGDGDPVFCPLSPRI